MIPALSEKLLGIATYNYFSKWFLTKKIDLEDFKQICHEVNAVQYHKYNSDVKLLSKFKTFDDYMYVCFTKRLLDELIRLKIIVRFTKTEAKDKKSNRLFLNQKDHGIKLIFSDNLEIFNPSYNENYIDNLLLKQLKEVANSILTRQEKTVLKGMLEDKSQIIISKEVGLSEARISQLKRQVITKLKEAIG